jgi:twitching motility protein PilU
MKNLEKLLRLMAEKNASDLFLATGSPVTIKINGVCVPMGQERLHPQDVVDLLTERLSDSQFRELETRHELNVGLPLQGVGSFRLSAFHQRGTVSAVLRYIPSQVPHLESLHLPASFKELALARRGLILLVGAAGSGKSTSIASMIDYRNEIQTGHILTFEDPIEFLFQNKKSIVNQREIGTDAHSLQEAMKSAMRQAPDMLFIGEIRDRDTMGASLAYAMSGHCVIATMHATNSANALNRIISFYSPETRAALFEDISVSLKAVVCQRLVRSRKGGRVPAIEMLMNTGHTRDLIVRGDVSGLKEALAQSVVPENQSFEQSLYELLKEEEITREDALAAADSENDLLWYINNTGKRRPDPKGTQAQESKGASFSEITLNI